MELVEIVGCGDAEPNAVHSRFAEGLAAFRAGDWAEAIRSLQAALELDADDGPSRFYLQKAVEFRRNPPERWNGVVLLDAK
ncbi:tetratricopeptide repeat protein [Methylomonas koyamae]|uniref:tetratricopeptide repeat protein n=1 Tax=Methylomonas koyamae TaxID=702114 RepID=UPI00210FD324|nr:tetratricopeptide repeat protein [Methylomonas koyamae]